jgi:hypothetical protein
LAEHLHSDFKEVQMWAGHGSLTLTLDRYGYLLAKEKHTADAECELFRVGKAWPMTDRITTIRMKQHVLESPPCIGSDPLAQRLPRACCCRNYGDLAPARSERDHLCHALHELGHCLGRKPNEPIGFGGRTLGLAFGEAECHCVD